MYLQEIGLPATIRAVSYCSPTPCALKVPSAAKHLSHVGLSLLPIPYNLRGVQYI